MSTRRRAHTTRTNPLRAQRNSKELAVPQDIIDFYRNNDKNAPCLFFGKDRKEIYTSHLLLGSRLLRAGSVL